MASITVPADWLTVVAELRLALVVVDEGMAAVLLAPGTAPLEAPVAVVSVVPVSSAELPQPTSAKANSTQTTVAGWLVATRVTRAPFENLTLLGAIPEPPLDYHREARGLARRHLAAV